MSKRLCFREREREKKGERKGDNHQSNILFSSFRNQRRRVSEKERKMDGSGKFKDPRKKEKERNQKGKQDET